MTAELKSEADEEGERGWEVLAVVLAVCKARISVIEGQK